MQIERDFKGIWIPKEIWLDKNLSAIEKLFLAEIESLSKHFECYASNEYFANFFNLSKDRVSKIISSLGKRGYIKSKIIYKKDNPKQVESRKIIAVPLWARTTRPSRRNQLPPIGENNEDIIYNNNIDDNIYLKEFININSSSHFSESQKSCDNPDDLVEIDEEKSVKEKNKKFDQTSDPYLLAKYLEKNIVSNNPKFPQTESQKQRWAKDIDRMIRIDKLLPDDIAEVIRWCQNDSFWKCNVLSGKKLRDRYQQLRMSMISRQ